MIDFLLDVLFTSALIWLGVGVGVLAAIAAWFLLPTTADRASVGALCVVAGFFGGLLLEYLAEPPSRH